MNIQTAPSTETVKTSGFAAFFSPEASRLEAAIGKARLRLTHLAADSQSVAIMGPLLDKAAQALKKRNIDLGWQFVKMARRAEVSSLDCAEVHGRALEMFHETEEKFTSQWRRRTILDLLRPLVPEVAKKGDASDIALPGAKEPAAKSAAGEKSKKKKAKKPPAKILLPEAQVRLKLASELRDEHFDNIYFKNSILRRYQIITLGALIIFVITIIALGAADVFPFTKPAKIDATWQLLLASAIFGLLGSSFSSIQALMAESRKLTRERIPKQGVQVKTLFIRLFIGASAGLMAYILLVSGILLPGDQSFNEAPVEYFYFFAFASGFSDRLIIKGIDLVTGHDRTKIIERKETVLLDAPEPSGTTHEKILIEHSTRDSR